jgi:hypothetical protein
MVWEETNKSDALTTRLDLIRYYYQIVFFIIYFLGGGGREGEGIIW